MVEHYSYRSNVHQRKYFDNCNCGNSSNERAVKLYTTLYSTNLSVMSPFYYMTMGHIDDIAASTFCWFNVTAIA